MRYDNDGKRKAPSGSSVPRSETDARKRAAAHAFSYRSPRGWQSVCSEVLGRGRVSAHHAQATTQPARNGSYAEPICLVGSVATECASATCVARREFASLAHDAMLASELSDIPRHATWRVGALVDPKSITHPLRTLTHVTRALRRIRAPFHPHVPSVVPPCSARCALRDGRLPP